MLLIFALLANNKSLTSLFLYHCSIPSEGQCLMTAGIISNSNMQLQILTGFRIGCKSCHALILSIQSAHSKYLSFESPLAGDAIVVEANGVIVLLVDSHSFI